MNEDKKEDEIFCPECGKPIKRNTVICSYCGMQIKELETKTISIVSVKSKAAAVVLQAYYLL